MSDFILKTDPAVFQDVLEGKKTFEIRFNDRGYQVGDLIVLKETKFTGQQMGEGRPLIYTGREMQKQISYILSGYGLQDGWVILGITDLDNQQTIIDNLKAQLNNMEACYIEKKKRVELLESNIKNLVVQLSNNYEVAEGEYKKNADTYYSGKCDAFDLAEQLACLALRGDSDQHLTR